jgi:glycosyltransferase involved in cell wall biosynthesis
VYGIIAACAISMKAWIINQFSPNRIIFYFVALFYLVRYAPIHELTQLRAACSIASLLLAYVLWWRGYRVLSEFAGAWTDQNHDVAFLCPDSSDEPYFHTKAKIIWVDGEGNVSHKRDTKVKLCGWYHIQALFRGLNAIGRQYDVILANHWMSAWSVALASSGKAKKIYYVQAYEPVFYTQSRTLKGYVLAMLAALTYHLPLRRIVNSPIYFRYRNLRASEFVPPGIDLTLFNPAVDVKDLETGESIVIGCIGRSESIKGILYVLRAFEEISRLDKRFFCGLHTEICRMIGNTIVARL